MSAAPRRRALAALAALLALLFPSAAFGHASLVRTTPSASGTVSPAPSEVVLTFSEPVEPRFAAVSISDAAGEQVTAGRPSARQGDAASIVVPLREIPPGWYLVYWRVVSSDGHPVRGAYTFAVGPNPGPAPEFVVPSVAESAATPRLVGARWILMLAAMTAIGLFVMRMLIARPAGVRLRALNRAFGVAALVALLAAPAYLLFATAQFSLRSPLDLGALAPLFDASAFGRGYLVFELCLLLFSAAAAIAIAVDRPERPRRSVAELLALTGALLAAGAVLAIPGLAGHPGYTSPRGVALALDWTHFAAGSIWLGGLIGLLVARPPLSVVKRFSNAAFATVGVLVATGTVAALLQLPTLASMWETGYGRSLMAKVALLALVAPIAGRNLLRTHEGRGARLVGAEVAAVAGAVLAAAVLVSLAPPAKAVADLGEPAARVGPGAVDEAVEHGGYRLRLQVEPNRAAVPNRFALTLTRDGRPVTGATVTAGFAMLDMEMGTQSYRLPETEPGVYGREAPALVMVGLWGLTFEVEPPGGAPFTLTILDRAGG